MVVFIVSYMIFSCVVIKPFCNEEVSFLIFVCFKKNLWCVYWLL